VLVGRSSIPKTLKLHGTHATVWTGLVLGIVGSGSGVEVARQHFPDANLGLIFLPNVGPERRAPPIQQCNSMLSPLTTNRRRRSRIF